MSLTRAEYTMQRIVTLIERPCWNLSLTIYQRADRIPNTSTRGRRGPRIVGRQSPDQIKRLSNFRKVVGYA